MDLKQAQAIKITEVALGDRVLATPEPGTSNLRRIVVMSATDIEKKNAADKADWAKRGVSGVVASKSGNDITLKIRTMGGEQQAVVTVGEKTAFKRYAPDSVKFADARNSKLGEIGIGDQVRARGQKSEDGLKVTAEDVVFGTFVTKAGAITAVNPETREVTVKDLASNKPLTIKFTADSQMKKMPDMSAMMGGMGRGGAPAGGTPPAGMARGGGMPGRGGMGGMDINAMLERMPQTKLEDLKPGEMVVVSSTKGAKSDQVTAIMMLANADFLLQMAAAQSGGGAGRGPGMGGGGGMGMGGGGMDALGGMGLGGIMP
jgi:transcription antitermination factor NusG